MVDTGGFSSFLGEFLTLPVLSTSLDDEMDKAKYFSGKIKYKGEGTRVKKDISLASSSRHTDIPPNVYMNGLIMSVPCDGKNTYFPSL